MPIRLPVAGASSGLRVAAVGQAVFGGHGLQRPDEDSPVAAAAHAGRFARRRADQAASQRQGVVAPDHLDRGAVVAVPQVGDEAGDVDVGRAGLVARGGMMRQIETHALRTGLAPHVAFPLARGSSAGSWSMARRPPAPAQPVAAPRLPGRPDGQARRGRG